MAFADPSSSPAWSRSALDERASTGTPRLGYARSSGSRRSSGPHDRLRNYAVPPGFIRLTTTSLDVQSADVCNSIEQARTVIAIPAPMQAPEALRAPFASPDWLYEIKFDGYRCMAGVEADDGFKGEGEDKYVQLALRVRLQTKSGADCTLWYPEVVEALATLPGGPHVIDGEACVLRPDGVSDFNAFQERARRRRWYPGAPRVTLCAFDLLIHDGERITELPLVERKHRLQQLLAGVPKQAILFVGDLPADPAVFQAMIGADLPIEGVMAKRRDSTYQPGMRSPHWVKIKRPGWREGRFWKN